MAVQILTEEEQQQVNWRRFCVTIGIEGGNSDGIKFTQVELKIMRLLLSQELNGEVVKDSSDGLRMFAQVITAMEQFMADRGM